MSNEVPTIALVKNQWLADQVNVQFPTKESLAGHKIYQQHTSQRSYRVETIENDPVSVLEQAEIYVVDFHRLTIMFALLQATRWQNESEQELIIEFLTQIIYSEPCDLILAFANGEPIASAIFTVSDSEALISDIVIKRGVSIEQKAFIDSLQVKFAEQLSSVSKLYIEEDDK